jgi:predicted nucleic acid-binding protein
MTTALDTNVIVALWDKDASLSSAAQSALEERLGQGSLVVAAPIFAELAACPGRDEAFLNSFFNETGIAIDWTLNESTWRASGRAFRAYAQRRRKQRGPGPRRILADFIIGAHASVNGYPLLTLDDRFYRSAFPGLEVLRV